MGENADTQRAHNYNCGAMKPPVSGSKLAERVSHLLWYTQSMSTRFAISIFVSSSNVDIGPVRLDGTDIGASTKVSKVITARKNCYFGWAVPSDFPNQLCTRIERDIRNIIVGGVRSRGPQNSV